MAPNFKGLLALYCVQKYQHKPEYKCTLQSVSEDGVITRTLVCTIKCLGARFTWTGPVVSEEEAGERAAAKACAAIRSKNKSDKAEVSDDDGENEDGAAPAPAFELQAPAGVMPPPVPVPPAPVMIPVPVAAAGAAPPAPVIPGASLPTVHETTSAGLGKGRDFFEPLPLKPLPASKHLPDFDDFNVERDTPAGTSETESLSDDDDSSFSDDDDEGGYSGALNDETGEYEGEYDHLDFEDERMAGVVAASGGSFVGELLP